MNVEKNILDLDYQTFLNFFNIIALFIGTAYITVVIGTLDKIDWDAFKITSTAIFAFLLVILIWLLFYSKLKRIKEVINDLK